jgi:MOSC domain-containing protein YiiM
MSAPPISAGRLLSLNISAARPMRIDDREVMTGIGKRGVTGPLAVGALGLAGDEQADLSVHGGPGKAVYAYPSEHYPFWQTVRAQARAGGWDETLPPGALGENLTLAGLLEDQVCVGDVLRFPDCELAVSEPRFPCFKFNAAMGFKQASKLMVQSGWCGFYLDVRRPGTLSAGQTFEWVPGPREVGISELFRARVAPHRR